MRFNKQGITTMGMIASFVVVIALVFVVIMLLKQSSGKFNDNREDIETHTITNPMARITCIDPFTQQVHSERHVIYTDASGDEQEMRCDQWATEYGDDVAIA